MRLGVLLLIIGIFLVVFIAVASCGVLVDESMAVRALEKQGYSNIEIVDKDIWFVSVRGCGEEDVAKFDVAALNPAGKEVEVFVCAGWPFKGATIRTD